MKKQVPRLFLFGLFALSFSTAVGIFAEVARAVPPPIACPACDLSLGCAGSTCTCQWQQNCNCYKCVPPVK